MLHLVIKNSVLTNERRLSKFGVALLFLLPMSNRGSNAPVNVHAGSLAFFRMLFCALERQLHKHVRAHRQHGFHQTLREHEVRGIGVYDCLHFAGMGAFLQSLLHAPDVPCRVPQHIVLRTDEQKLAPNVLHLDELCFRNGVCRFGIVKQLSGMDPVACTLCFGGNALPILWMLVDERNIGKRLSVIGKKGFVLYRPFLAAIRIAP